MVSGSRHLTAVSAGAALALAIAFPFWGGRFADVSARIGGADELPVVKITAPANNSAYKWNSLVNYSVVVTYQGKSTQYQEIPSGEVLVATTYVADLSKRAGETAAAPLPAGLLEIARSKCVGCHEFKATAMGPSFAAIAARYPDNPASIDTLSRYIREGSTGVWGQGSMPAHPEMTNEQLHAMALWIVKYAADPNVNYYAGTEGAFRMEAPATPGPNGGLILTASYTASPADQKQDQRGQDTVLVRGK